MFDLKIVPDNLIFYADFFQKFLMKNGIILSQRGFKRTTCIPSVSATVEASHALQTRK